MTPAHVPTSQPVIYEYAVIRYLPCVERGETINVGLIMMSKRYRWLRVAIHLDERRLEAFDPKVDVARLRHLLSLFTRTDCPDPSLPVEERYRWLTAVKSAVIQTSPSHPGIISPSSPDSSVNPLPVADLLDLTFDSIMAQMVL